MARIDSRNPAWDDARRLANSCVPPLPRVRRSLSDAINYILAEELRAQSDLPPAHTAMMDGYAVCGEPPWAVIGQVHAGQAATVIDNGQALRVSTGAHIPRFTSMVVPQEVAVVEDGIVVGMIEQPRNSNIREPGDEAREGELICTAGVVFTSAIAGLAATCGYDFVEVYERPVIDVIITGDELIDAGPSRPGAIRDSLSMQVPAWIEWAGARVGTVTKIHDSLSEMVRSLEQAQGHIVIITGGSSHGPRDFARPALAELNAEFIVDEINSRPGHPTALAGLPGGQVVANLPGNPLATCVAFMTVVDPVIAGLTGRSPRTLRPAVMNEAISVPVTRVMPVTVDFGVATPAQFRGSAMLRGLAHADAFAIVRAGEETFDCSLLPVPW